MCPPLGLPPSRFSQTERQVGRQTGFGVAELFGALEPKPTAPSAREEKAPPGEGACAAPPELACERGLCESGPGGGGG